MTEETVAREAVFVLSTMVDPPDLGSGFASVLGSEIDDCIIALPAGPALKLSLDEYSDRYVKPAMRLIAKRAENGVFLKPRVSGGWRVVSLGKISLAVSRDYDIQNAIDYIGLRFHLLPESVVIRFVENNSQHQTACSAI